MLKYVGYKETVYSVHDLSMEELLIKQNLKTLICFMVVLFGSDAILANK